MSTRVGDVLTKAAEFLAARVPASPRADAELLMGHVLGCERLDLYRVLDRPIDDEERTQFRELIRRRAGGEPVAYIIGRRGFWTLDLHITPDVLIPRPETEHLIEAVLEFVGDRRERSWRIVDVGTGSGAIALALASELPNATVVGVDISPEALAVAADNADRCELRERVHLVCGDGLKPLLRRGSKADIVVSNPPYIGRGDPRLEAQVKAWEPDIALFAGEDGLAMIPTLVREAALVLEDDGFLAMEFGQGQWEAVRAIAGDHFAAINVLRDLSGIDRVLVASKQARPATGDGLAGFPSMDEVGLAPAALSAEQPGNDTTHDTLSVEREMDPRLLGGASGREPIPVIDLNAE